MSDKPDRPTWVLTVMTPSEDWLVDECGYDTEEACRREAERFKAQGYAVLVEPFDEQRDGWKFTKRKSEM